MRAQFVAHAPVEENSSIAGALKREFPIFGERPELI
jgi:hypothetical protein